MLFSSIVFLYYFLPVALLLYFIAPKKFRNTVLLMVSLVFYGWGEPKHLLLMTASIIIGYLSGLMIEAFHTQRAKKLVMAASVTISLGFLAWFKYTDFFIENFNKVFGLSIPLLKIALPIGISFYTFQILSYTVDVYRGEVPAQKNLINLAAYISLFPQLIAGPIVRYSQVENELREREYSFSNFAIGMRRFVLGLGKKILIANILGELCDSFRASGDKSVLFYWLYAAAFALHIYFDFSGYSDMAIGLGRIMGFHFPENFNYPFISKSATEFWRRWHISLGSWFRDYVYIPLGGNRVKKSRWFLNISIVWLLTGLWHGAAWNFVVWGLFFAVLLITEKLFLLKYLEKSKVFSRIYMIFVLLISFVIFNSADMEEAVSYIGAMFGEGELPLVSKELGYYLKDYGIILIIAIIGATPLIKNMVLKIRENHTAEIITDCLEPAVLVGLMLVTTAFLVDGSFNPFLYFRF